MIIMIASWIDCISKWALSLIWFARRWAIVSDASAAAADHYDDDDGDGDFNHMTFAF